MNRRLLATIAVNAAILLAGVGAGLLVSHARRTGGAPAPDTPADTHVAAHSEHDAPDTPRIEWDEPDRGAENYWPLFRGPTGMGIVSGDDWPSEWDGETGEGIAWEVDLPLQGKNSPVVWGDKIFLTAADTETQLALCYDRNTGEELWRTEIPAPRGRDWPIADVQVFPDTGYAAPTSVVDRFALYVMFATADVAALDHDGNLLWSRNLGKPDSAYGFSASLTRYGQTVIVQYDVGGGSETDSALYGLNRQTGSTVWRTPRPVPNSWSSPVVAETSSGPQVLTAADPWVIAYDPSDGREIWRAAGLSGDVAPSPVYADGIAYFTTDYAYILAVRVDGEGDVTDTHLVWEAQEGMSDASSPVCDGEVFLQINSGGFMTCYGAKDGELLWYEEFLGPYWSSITRVGDLYYLPAATRDGPTRIFEVEDGFELIAEPTLGQPVHTVPAFVDGKIYIRGEETLFCIGE